MKKEFLVKKNNASLLNNTKGPDKNRIAHRISIVESFVPIEQINFYYEFKG